MAVTRLGEKELGSLVKLNENGAPVEFYVAKHDYESELNGPGRTLLVRKDCYDIQQFSGGSAGRYANSEIDRFLKNTYKALLPADIQAAMGNTIFYYTPGMDDWSVTTLARPVFHLSATELGQSDNYMNVEGAPLPIADKLKIAYLNGLAQSQWTRSPRAHENGLYHVWGVGENGSLKFVTDYDELGSRPVFTLPSSLIYVRDDGFASTNTPPTKPRITSGQYPLPGGGRADITWSASIDRDGDLIGYSLERQVNSGEWQEVYRGAELMYTDMITKGWGRVAYRVRAYDSCGAYSDYSVTISCPVNNNTAPVVTFDSDYGSDLGIKTSGFSIGYTVTDDENDAVTVTETMDGVTKRTFTPTSGASNSFTVTGDYFMQLPNGQHTLSIIASDGKVSTCHELKFIKAVHQASITLAEPLAIAGDITVAVLAVVGNIPEDAIYQVEATNNGKDPSPVWQDVTAEVQSGGNIVFHNHVAANGAAFNFRITVERGASNTGGYISAVTGAFQ